MSSEPIVCRAWSSRHRSFSSVRSFPSSRIPELPCRLLAVSISPPCPAAIVAPAGVSRHVLRVSAAGVLSQSSIIELLACQNCMQQHSLRVGCLFGGFAVGTLRQAARSRQQPTRSFSSVRSSKPPELPNPRTTAATVAPAPVATCPGPPCRRRPLIISSSSAPVCLSQPQFQYLVLVCPQPVLKN